MAPSSNSMLLALLVAFAVVAPSMAARDAKAAAAAPAPSSAGDEVLQPMGFFDDLGHLIGDIPDLPLPRILPCPPAFPIKIPFIPCYNLTTPPVVTECRPSLAKYMPPCAAYLTNGSDVPSSPPPSSCCAAVQQFFEHQDTNFLCLCHVVNGDASKLLKVAPANRTREVSILRDCGYGLGADQAPQFCAGKQTGNVPPMDAAAPPPRRFLL
ncbi:hypothetical protein HU200_041290 [Digitaria exilis]|uniref:Bifunctional inhibitor/plant lipid transfer protein/seed storage helical domain-containing protein n=1 Tax=Digitaria exilis TaxID=1010633 RepID=A0A835B893_9POAL|nr:hypothetical protein HU200_041290 [Digitaria exilis]